MIAYLSELGAWNWLILAGLFMALELMAPGVFLIWLGIAAAITGLLALTIDFGWQLQLVLFAVLSLIAVFFAQKYFRSEDVVSDRPLLNKRAEQHVGKSFVLVEAIVNGRGKVKVGDSHWRVEGPDTPKGKSVTVTGADGTVLQVKPAKG